MPLKAVLFDMDGVIVDTEPLHRKAYFQMFSDFGIEVSDDFYASFTGSSTKKVAERLIGHFGMSHSVEEISEHKRRYFKHYFDHDIDFDLLPGVKDLIENYFENGVKLVLASSAHMNTINWVFEKFDLEKYFTAKISGADLQESKPHPEIFIRAAEMASEPKENCMVIEDSTNGIEASVSAEIFCVAYQSSNSEKQQYEKANLKISDFSEIYFQKMKEFFN
ncbi:HAD family hydrolase [Chryseobacterium sp.]|uniref:HAD family hydrolase n=1 Tax=Chryseobacterium sp. TaxID=1871047 RepID=UPI0011CB8CAD|nr:HAD family phosphatase [Chryseobacterium sp.]TXF77585.1 HAD family phosphatase [Chryseobacterium sp.]